MSSGVASTLATTGVSPSLSQGKDRGRNYSFVTAQLPLSALVSARLVASCSPRLLAQAGWPVSPVPAIWVSAPPLSHPPLSPGNTRPGVDDLAVPAWPAWPPSPLMSSSEEMRK